MVYDIASGAYLNLSEGTFRTVGMSLRWSWGGEVVGGIIRRGTSRVGIAWMCCKGNGGEEGMVAVLPQQFPMGR